MTPYVRPKPPVVAGYVRVVVGMLAMRILPVRRALRRVRDAAVAHVRQLEGN